MEERNQRKFLVMADNQVETRGVVGGIEPGVRDGPDHMISGKTGKRDRPWSSYNDAPATDMTSYLTECLRLQNKGMELLLVKDSEYSSGSDTEADDVEREPAASPLLNRKPFRNLTNFVSSLDFPNVKRKLGFSGKSLAKSASETAGNQRDGSEGTMLRPKNSFKHATSEVANNESARKGSVSNRSTSNETVNYNGSADSEAGSPVTKSGNSKTHIKFHSMCQTSKEKEAFQMTDNSRLPNTSIRHFKDADDLLPRIDEDELHQIITGRRGEGFDDFIIIDCRFNYEYDGGHIINALNISSQRDLEESFIHNLKYAYPKRTLLIFHCELSVLRGPRMASHLRKCDRILNKDNYPYLSYPDIVVLEGGYKKFFNKFRNHCHPQSYIEMKNENFREKCLSEMDKIRLQTKLPRAHSFNQPIKPATSKEMPLRSDSSATVTSHAQNLKILKRQRSEISARLNASKSEAVVDSTHGPNEDISKAGGNFSNSFGQSKLKMIDNLQWSSGSVFCDDSFQPPSALFKMENLPRRNSSSKKSRFSSSTMSVNSSISSICSDQGWGSSIDSFSDVNALPQEDILTACESKNSIINNPKNNGSYAKLQLLKPRSLKPSVPVPPLPKSTKFTKQDNKSSPCQDDIQEQDELFSDAPRDSDSALSEVKNSRFRFDPARFIPKGINEDINSPMSISSSPISANIANYRDSKVHFPIHGSKFASKIDSPNFAFAKPDHDEKSLVRGRYL